jgi:SAM-dependent methyltransferase
MATPWDRAAKGYVNEWMPRFVPYHQDLVHELALPQGARVLVVSAGPGAEAIAAARLVGAQGFVRATDKSEGMVALCRDLVKSAGVPVECGVADAGDASGGPWDAILCAFGLWQLSDREAVIRAWTPTLARRGKVGILTWGPGESEDPFEQLARCLAELEPAHAQPSPRIACDRDRIADLFEQANLSLVRHTVVRHTLSFKSAEAFVGALAESCTWRKVWEALGDARMARVASKFYGLVGGPAAPLSFTPPATLAIAAHPGEEIELAHRPSVRVPASRRASSIPPAPSSKGTTKG